MRRRDFLRLTGLAAACAIPVNRLLAAAPHRMGDVIIVLPGITGSVLRKDGRDVWALSGSGILNALQTTGASLNALRLSNDSPELDDIGDGITADRLFDDVQVIPGSGFFKIDGYSGLRSRLQEAFDIVPGKNYFEFPYDWRRDNRAAARQLARRSSEWLRQWRISSGNKDAKLIFLAHSMGGLVARYCIEVLGGWRDTRTLITFGTPFRGAVNALNFMCNGYRKKAGFFNVIDLSDVLRSLTSMYQLLPTYPCIEAADGTQKRVSETTGLAYLDVGRAKAALDFHQSMNAAVQRNLKDEAYRRSGYTGVLPIAGGFQPTFQYGKVLNGSVNCVYEFPGQDIDGDGTVPRPSATPLELEGRTTVLVSEKHGSLQNLPAVLDHAVGKLVELKLTWERFREGPELRLGLAIDDGFFDDEPIQIALTHSPNDAVVPVMVAIADARTRQQVGQQTTTLEGKAPHVMSFDSLPPGPYRIHVTGSYVPPGSTPQSRSVTDLFLVAPRKVG